MPKSPNTGGSHFNREQLQANINSHPNHPAVSHLVPDRQTLNVNAFILSKCCMLVCLLGRICHYELTSVPRAKILVISEITFPHSNFENKTHNQRVKKIRCCVSCSLVGRHDESVGMGENLSLLKETGQCCCANLPL